jgi:hypothetical protein
MFQYALGRHLALRKRCTLKVDLSNYSLYRDRQYELKHLSPECDIASFSDIVKFKPFGRRARLLSMPWRILRPGKYNVIKEKTFCFDPSILDLPDDTYLEGYWQSYKYFSDIADTIRKEFSLSASPDKQNIALVESIASDNAVSIHIRRGDYVNDSWARDTLGVTEPSYYRTAIDYIRQKVQNPVFYIFSDDPAWASSHIKWEAPFHVVSQNPSDRGWLDLNLMRRCRYHIIANSTFSWWGAWLSLNPEKIVVAPKQWFRTDQYDSRDLIPAEWIRI